MAKTNLGDQHRNRPKSRVEASKSLAVAVPIGYRKCVPNSTLMENLDQISERYIPVLLSRCILHDWWTLVILYFSWRSSRDGRSLVRANLASLGYESAITISSDQTNDFEATHGCSASPGRSTLN
jgi:hypothetical protein